MLISPINTINYKKNNQSTTLKMNHVSPASSNSFSEVIYPNYNVLKSQMLYKSSQINGISFQKISTPGLFKKVGAFEPNSNWAWLIVRESSLYIKANELRSEFRRDFDRILHSDAYNKLSRKTQVFTHPKSDTTSFRIHHVNQVSSIAETLSDFFGLNTELVRTIAKGHDLGHAPFGHGGERTLSAIMKKLEFSDSFWHEKNSLRVIDDIDTKLDPDGWEQNLNLTYAVRDGIISHCGEVDENGLIPRPEYLDLRTITKNNRPQPFTWEGCVVKIADKIAYLGKDLEDAINNKFLHPDKLQDLKKIVKEETGLHFDSINNTVLINHFIADLCANSSPEKGLHFSHPTFELMNTIKKFNYKNIYLPKDAIQGSYYDLSINTIFNTLDGYYKGKDTLLELDKLKESKHTLASGFSDWLIKYSNIAPEERVTRKYGNKIIYDIENPSDYKLAVIEYISSLTDITTTKVLEEIIFFG